MKTIRFIAGFIVAFATLISCGEKVDDPVPDTVNIVMVETSLNFSATGGSKDVTMKATGDWKVASAPDWITVSPSSGAASQSQQKVTVTAEENSASERSADVKFSAGDKTAVLRVSQDAAVVIDDSFRPEASKWYVYKKTDKVEAGKSYLLVALSKTAVPYPSETGYGYMNTTGVVIEDDEIVSMGRNAFTFTAAEGGYIISQAVDGRYIFLKDSYNSFQVEAELPAKGHVWTVKAGDAGMFTIKNVEKGKTFQYDPEFSTYAAYTDVKGTLPCLYECVKETAAPEKPTFTTVPKWLELPQTRDDDGLDFYSHDMVAGGKSMRSWSFDYDPEALLSHWVAYPLNKELAGRGSRTDEWGYDPFVPVESQPSLYSSYKGDWQRGHQLPSADRLNYDDNVKTFYFTNMTPQNGELNDGVWKELEDKVRKWSEQFDTLYVVTGCSIEGSTEVAMDNDGKAVTVPVGYYKALLGYSKAGSVGIASETGGYTGCAFWFDNKPYSGGYMDQAMTIADLEAKVGLDFFVNLDPAVAEKVEKTQDSWWK